MRHLRLVRDDERAPRTCECTDCGKAFEYGTEGDNETVCLRCEYLSTQDEGLGDYEGD